MVGAGQSRIRPNIKNKGWSDETKNIDQIQWNKNLNRYEVKFLSSEKPYTFNPSSVEFLSSATSDENSRASRVMDYFRRFVDGYEDMKDGRPNPTKAAFAKLDFIDPNSALAGYLSGEEIQTRTSTSAPIFPFKTNISQMRAVRNALTSNISIIEGPPGTGKTQTILNIIATLSTENEADTEGSTGGNPLSIGMVSSNNAAVDNVFDKLKSEGFEFVTANLGNKHRVQKFFDERESNKENLDEFLV